ncbi:MAG: PAS domain S-box protein [Deltaproteobacteria bacterium]|nr:PAS domain S-box protein [Deltaproteobacteria bacterium]
MSATCDQTAVPEDCSAQSDMRLFHAVFDATDNPMWICRISDGVIVEANHMFCLLLESTRELICGQDIFSLPWNSVDAIKKAFDGIPLSNPLSTPVEVHLRISEAHERLLSLTTRKIQFANEPCLLVVATDNTEKYRIASVLGEQEQMRNDIVQNVPGVVYQFRVRPDGTYYFSNISPRCEELTGYPADPNDRVWSTLGSSIYEADKAEFLSGVNAAIINHSDWESEVRYYAPDGSVRWLMGISRPAALLGDEKVHNGILFDVTERKNAEMKILQLKKYLSSIVDAMPVALIGMDADGCIVQWNRKAALHTGISRENALQLTARDILAHLDLPVSTFETCLGKNIPYQDSQKVRRLNGKRVFENIIIYPLLNSEHMDGAVILIEDVSERVEMEEQIIQNEKMLSIGGLAAGMAHEINNPLGAVMQTVQVLSTRLLSNDCVANVDAADAVGVSMEAIQQYLQIRKVDRMLNSIRESGARMAELVQNMLSFARKSSVEKEPHSLGTLLDDSLKLAEIDFSLKRNYDFRKINIVKEYSPDAITIRCKKTKIQQVFLNILGNSAFAMHSSNVAKPCIRIRTVLNSSEQTVRIEIEDNGPGMDEETQKRIFDPFFTTKSSGAGTGLGMSVSYFIIVEEHKGNLSVKTNPGHGAAFHITLPL